MKRPNIPDTDLLAFAAGDLDAARAEVIRSLLARDTDALATVRLYQAVARRTAGDDAVNPPAEVIARAEAIYRSPAEARSPGWLERLDAVIARCVYDSRLAPAAVRAVASADRLQLAFESDRIDLDLVCERQGQGDSVSWRLTGQLSGEEPVSQVRLGALASADGTEVAAAVADDHGHFSLDLQPGSYDLVVRSDRAVVFPGITLE